MCKVTAAVRARGFWVTEQAVFITKNCLLRCWRALEGTVCTARTDNRTGQAQVLSKSYKTFLETFLEGSSQVQAVFIKLVHFNMFSEPTGSVHPWRCSRPTGYETCTFHIISISCLNCNVVVLLIQFFLERFQHHIVCPCAIPLLWRHWKVATCSFE